MMRRTLFKIKLTGPRPEQVPARVLADLLIRIDDAVTKLARSSESELAAEGPTLSLVDIEEGSDLLTFSVPEVGLPAVAMLSAAIADQDFSKLPREVHADLHALSEKVLAAKWGLEFPGEPEAGIPYSVIHEDRSVPAPPSLERMTGSTTLLGRCVRVGGANEPRAEVRLTRGGKLLKLRVDEPLARKLGQRLYEEVLLEGQATWELPSWTIVDFQVTRILDFERVSVADIFKELEDSAEGAWTDVDAIEFTRRQRG